MFPTGAIGRRRRAHQLGRGRDRGRRSLHHRDNGAGRLDRHHETRPAQSGHPDRRHPVRRAAEHLRQLARASSPASTTNCSRAIAEKLGLRVEFVGTEFAGLLAQVAGKRFDVGSSSITTTDARREPSASPTATTSATSPWSCRRAARSRASASWPPSQRIGVVQGTVQDDYVVEHAEAGSGEVPRLQHRLREPEVRPDRRLGGAVAAGRGRDRSPAIRRSISRTPSASTTSSATRWPRTTSR